MGHLGSYSPKKSSSFFGSLPCARNLAGKVCPVCEALKYVHQLLVPVARRQNYDSFMRRSPKQKRSVRLSVPPKTRMPRCEVLGGGHALSNNLWKEETKDPLDRLHTDPRRIWSSNSMRRITIHSFVPRRNKSAFCFFLSARLSVVPKNEKATIHDAATRLVCVICLDSIRWIIIFGKKKQKRHFCSFLTNYISSNSFMLSILKT